MGLKEIKTKSSLNLSKANISKAIREKESSSRNINSAINSINSTRLNDVQSALVKIGEVNKHSKTNLAEIKNLVERMISSIE